MGENRQDRLTSLRASLKHHGIDVTPVVVPGVEHEGFKLLEPVKVFFSERLAARRAAP